MIHYNAVWTLNIIKSFICTLIYGHSYMDRPTMVFYSALVEQVFVGWGTYKKPICSFALDIECHRHSRTPPFGCVIARLTRKTL